MRRLLPAALAVLALLLTACGGDDTDSAAAPAARATATNATPSTFPATVEHRYGSTTVTKAPRRIVSVGATEQDVLLALGEKPVGVTEWYGDHPYATWPWAQAALGDSQPTVLHADDGINVEAVAKLHPDLIVGTNSGMDKNMYKKLSALAPTIAGPKGGTLYFSRWDVQTQLIADALGRHDAGAKLIAGVRQEFADALAAHPEFQDKTVTFSQNAFYDGKLYVYPPGLGVEFLDMLGFTVNPKIKPLARPGTQAQISAERLDVIDADVLVFATEKPADVDNLMKIPTFGPLDAVKHHRAVFTDPILSGAMYFETPLSLRYVAQHLTPLLAQAVAGKAPRKMAAR
ncbi:MAG TPA: iron-siderophore ABC transporter substrate-binding protein [Baekduia sp.]|uniref:iron-siderophore ABC transporter substrate-binding protein n=1 Tax=Baekduia sp. TaxID=2600305 RepID=UPI002D76E027|nr:iron-siderophore ABC transporter substrate-binding protein [Baekduia sp.]HET6509347.1 iron-siderophore ABC transporter substrate-binding protein [Baekduia sp.]